MLEAAGYDRVETELRCALQLDVTLVSGVASILASQEFEPGDVTVTLPTTAAPAGEQARTVATLRTTGACGRFGQHVVHANWRSPRGSWYVLAAGSRAVTGLTVTGDITGEADGPTLAVRARTAAGTRTIDLSAERSG